MEQYVVFKSHQQNFALRIDYVVKWSLRLPPFTQLPEVAWILFWVFNPLKEAMVPDH